MGNYGCRALSRQSSGQLSTGWGAHTVFKAAAAASAAASDTEAADGSDTGATAGAQPASVAAKPEGASPTDRTAATVASSSNALSVSYDRHSVGAAAAVLGGLHSPEWAFTGARLAEHAAAGGAAASNASTAGSTQPAAGALLRADAEIFAFGAASAAALRADGGSGTADRASAMTAASRNAGMLSAMHAAKSSSTAAAELHPEDTTTGTQESSAAAAAAADITASGATEARPLQDAAARGLKSPSDAARALKPPQAAPASALVIGGGASSAGQGATFLSRLEAAKTAGSASTAPDLEHGKPDLAAIGQGQATFSNEPDMAAAGKPAAPGRSREAAAIAGGCVEAKGIVEAESSAAHKSARWGSTVAKSSTRSARAADLCAEDAFSALKRPRRVTSANDMDVSTVEGVQAEGSAAAAVGPKSLQQLSSGPEAQPAADGAVEARSATEAALHDSRRGRGLAAEAQPAAAAAVEYPQDKIGDDMDVDAVESASSKVERTHGDICGSPPGAATMAGAASSNPVSTACEPVYDGADASRVTFTAHVIKEANAAIAAQAASQRPCAAAGGPKVQELEQLIEAAQKVPERVEAAQELVELMEAAQELAELDDACEGTPPQSPLSQSRQAAGSASLSRQALSAREAMAVSDSRTGSRAGVAATADTGARPAADASMQQPVQQAAASYAKVAEAGAAEESQARVSSMRQLGGEAGLAAKSGAEESGAADPNAAAAHGAPTDLQGCSTLSQDSHKLTETAGMGALEGASGISEETEGTSLPSEQVLPKTPAFIAALATAAKEGLEEQTSAGAVAGEDKLSVEKASIDYATPAAPAPAIRENTEGGSSVDTVVDTLPAERDSGSPAIAAALAAVADSITVRPRKSRAGRVKSGTEPSAADASQHAVTSATATADIVMGQAATDASSGVITSATSPHNIASGGHLASAERLGDKVEAAAAGVASPQAAAETKSDFDKSSAAIAATSSADVSRTSAQLTAKRGNVAGTTATVAAASAERAEAVKASAQQEGAPEEAEASDEASTLTARNSHAVRPADLPLVQAAASANEATVSRGQATNLPGVNQYQSCGYSKSPHTFTVLLKNRHMGFAGVVTGVLKR